jgi:O-antigen/teichoic acid export membrane protein
MKIESALIALMSVCVVFTAMLQGADKAKYPLIGLALGGVAKIVFELLFLKGSMGIYAVSIGNVICFAIAAAVNTFFALKFVKIKKGLGKQIAKYVGLTILFGLGIIVLVRVMPDNRWWVLLSGTVSLILYAILVALFRFFWFTKSSVGNTSKK